MRRANLSAEWWSSMCKSPLQLSWSDMPECFARAWNIYEVQMSTMTPNGPSTKRSNVRDREIQCQ